MVICHGKDGTNGTNGTDGKDGTTVLSLVRVSNEDAGANCFKGGKKIETGLDDDGDGELSASEVDSAAYICDEPKPTVSLGNLTWMKCLQGMTYNASTNGCDGAYPELEYCASNDNSCNGGSSGGLLGAGPVFDPCDTLDYVDHTD